MATITINRAGILSEDSMDHVKNAGSFLFTVAYVVLIGVLLYIAWINRAEKIWTAESGWGYGFGVTGGLMMLLLLIYPMRKRWRVLSKCLTVKFWFRVHMVFGVLGPVFIMLHSSYMLGSMNGRVAFFSMLIVAISGLFGRYFYTRIHHGLYGKKATFESIRSDSKELNKKLGPLFEMKPRLKESLLEYEEQAMEMPAGIMASAVHRIRMRYRAARLYRVAIGSLNNKYLAVARSGNWASTRVIREQLVLRNALLEHKKLLKQMQGLHFYERLFAIWHLFHLPLFIMMLITGFVHVYAVHAY